MSRARQPAQPPDAAQPADRLDKWLWHARFFRTRSLAARVVSGGIRVNGVRTVKPATQLRRGDVLTFVQGEQVRVVEVVDVALRRGGAAEAEALYRDLTPAPARAGETPAGAVIEADGPRPTKRDRRALDAVRRSAS